MHISEGVLSAPVLVAGAGLSLGGAAWGLRRISPQRLVLTSILAAVFFTATLIHVPLGPAATHLVLNGLLGIMLGPAAFPAILVGLFLQGVLFQYGGITTLGVNTFNMALPAVVFGVVFRPLLRHDRLWAAAGAFTCGFAAVLGSGLLTAASLAFTDEGFLAAAGLLLGGHVPVMIAEGFVTMSIVLFILRVRPGLLADPAGDTTKEHP
jgi:cobalt/nickel transport system permease protein